MADDLIFQAGIEGADDVADAAEQISSAWTKSMEKISDAIKETGGGIEDFSEHAKEAVSGVGESFGKLGGIFGESGNKIAELVEKFGALGEAGISTAAAIGGLAAALAGIAYAGARLGSHLEDLKESTEGSESDFAKLEDTASAVGLSIDDMTEAVNRSRDGFRNAALSVADYAETLDLMQDRLKVAQERAKFARERIALGSTPDKADLEALQKEQQAEAEKQEETMVKRMQTRIDRMVRAAEESGGGIRRLFTLGVDKSDAAQMQQVADQLDRLKDIKGPEQLIAVINQVNSLMRSSPQLAGQVERALNEAFGSHIGFEILQRGEDIRKGLATAPEVAEKVGAEMGHLSEAQRANLDGLSRDMATAFESIENAVGHLADALQKLGAGEALKGIANVINQIATAFDDVSDHVEAFSKLLDKATESAVRLGRALHLPDLSWLAQYDPTGTLRAAPGSAAASGGMQSGGLLHGPGTSTSDSIPIRASRGEYVVNATAVSHYGVGLMNAINSRRYQEGGSVADDKQEKKQARAHAKYLQWMMKRYPRATIDDIEANRVGDWRDVGLFKELYPDDADGAYRFGGLVGGLGRGFASGGFVGFQGGGLAAGAANVSGGSSLHPITMVMPSGRAVGGFSASPGAVAAFSHEAAVRRSTSIGRRSSAEG